MEKKRHSTSRQGALKLTAVILVIISILSVVVLTGCSGENEAYEITVTVDNDTIRADGRDSIKFTAEVRDKAGDIINIKNEEIEYYEIIDRRNYLIVYPEQYRTKLGGRREIFAKYKDVESEVIRIRASEIYSNEINLIADTINTSNVGDSVGIISEIYSVRGELFGKDKKADYTIRTIDITNNGVSLGNGTKAAIKDEQFIAEDRGLYYVTAKYTTTESNAVVINASDRDVSAEGNMKGLSIEGDTTYLLGITNEIKFKDTLLDSENKKIVDKTKKVSFYLVNKEDNTIKEIIDGKFNTDKEGKYVVFAVCEGFVSNTINLRAIKPEFIKAIDSAGTIKTTEDGVNTVTSKLPVIVINTDGNTINGDNKVNAVMSIYDNADKSEDKVNKITDVPKLITNIRIKQRGQSSQTFPKKQYGIELKDSNWEDFSYPILGMGKEEDWILNGSYADKSLLRNHIAYKLAAQATEYAPNTKFCEVYINESNDSDNPYNYMGIYLMIEKIKIDKNRVNIDKLDPTITSGEALTGGYIVAKDKLKDGEERIRTERGEFAYVSPSYDKMNEEQKSYIERYMNDFLKSVYSSNFDDPKTGYANYLDLESYAEVLAINELTKCIDGMNISLYYYKPRNEKLHAGPAWDFDLSMGNVDYRTGTDPAGWYCVSLDEVPRRIMSDYAFQIMFKTKWNELREEVFSDANINKIIDEALDSISGGPIERSVARWPGQWNGMFVWPYPQDGSAPANHKAEVEWVRSFLLQRSEWIDNNISGNIDLEPVWYDWINEFTGERMNPKPDENSMQQGRYR